MNKEKVLSNFQKIFMALCAVLALLTLIDYRFSKNTTIDKIIDKTRSLENRYNVGRNYYYGYYLNTAERTINVSKEFQNNVVPNDDVEVEHSLLFNNINRITSVSSRAAEVYSLRIASGLVLPSLVLLILGIGYKLGNRIGTLVFIAEIVLLVNFYFLLR